MNKQDLVRKIAEITGGTQKDAKVYLDAVTEAIVEGLQEEGKVQIVGFANFEVKETAERNGFNPATQRPMVIPAGKRVSCKISNKVKDLFK